MSKYEKFQFKLRRIPEVFGLIIGLMAFVFSPRSDVHHQDPQFDGTTLFAIADADVPSCGSGADSGGNDACGCAGGCASDSADSDGGCGCGCGGDGDGG